ncbi:halocin C8-like domain-containing protein [Halorhabdus rudnickae]|uniref:halocin C8-like domain-containing protein n=1 Tax=Halorhabdus rudnickae TaxID=1775544 RepID=UPI001082EA2E|nr:halocin C8-like domain-containing protein [Halorhabdus rudnickae]
MKAYGKTENGMGTIDTVVDSSIENSQQKDEVTIAMPDLSCYGCSSIVGIACAGAASLSLSSCASAAISSGVFSPWAGGAVAAFCTYIVANAGTLSCAAGTTAICAGAGFCEMTE